MAESMVRLERQGGFTVLQNGMLRDPRLSLKTKGLFAVMISLPGDWSFNISGLAAINRVGKDAIRSALSEMEKAGYLTREQTHGEHGKFGGTLYIVHEESKDPVSVSPSSGFPTTVNPTTANPMTGEPTSAEPISENPTLQNKDLVNKDLTKAPHTPRKKTEKADLPQETKDLLNEFLADKPKLTEIMREFVQARREVSKAKHTTAAFKAILSRLEKYSGGNMEVMWDMLSLAASRHWITVYKPRDKPGLAAGEVERYVE